MTLACAETDEQLDLSDSHLERRRGLRIRQARPVRVYEGGNGRYFGGETEDISSTGLRILLPAAAVLRPGRLISLHVGTTTIAGAMRPAKVVWFVRGQSLDFMVAGVELLACASAQLKAA
jgi:hypothetical protein